MGVGKSTIGKKLARRLELGFIDCDQELEKRTGATVRLIFDIEGESGFRNREQALLAELADTPVGIVATGGGVVTVDANRAVLKNAGRVIYLKASLETLWSRLRFSKHRPLLETENPKETLSKLLNARDPLYQEVATDIVFIRQGPVSHVVRKIENLLKTEPQSS